MTPFSVRLKLVGPDGDSRPWTIRSGKTPYNTYGECDWVNRIITINRRLRNPETIRLTILHEIAHVTAGQNASEHFVINLEKNFKKACKETEPFFSRRIDGKKSS